MKVLYPIGSLYPSQSGGPSNTIYWLAKALVSKNIAVKIVTSNQGIEEGKVLLNKWLETEYGEVRYCTTRIHYLPFRVLYYTLVSLRGCDIVHLTALFYPPSWITAIAGVLLNKKIVWSTRGELHKSALNFSSRRKQLFIKFLSFLPIKNVIFHATSSEEAEIIKRQFGTSASVVILPNFIDIKAIIKAETTAPYFLFVGRLHPIKNLDKLIEGLAASEIFKQSNLLLKIAGNGDASYQQQLQELAMARGIGNKVEFLGSVTGDAKDTLFAGAKFSFLLSQSENFGNVVLESLAQGTPMVTSKGTPWASLSESNAGYWIDTDVKILSNLIDGLLQIEEKKYHVMRVSARKFAENNFDISNNIFKWITVYKELLNGKSVSIKHVVAPAIKNV